MKKTGWAKKHRINNRLTEMRQAHPEVCFTRKEIADYCEVDVSTIRKIERGAIKKIWKKLNLLHETK